MSESVWARLRRYAAEPWKHDGGAWPDLMIEAADRGKALDLEISLRQKQTIRDALERERAKRRIEELERALADIENYYAQHYREGEVGYQAVLIARNVKR